MAAPLVGSISVQSLGRPAGHPLRQPAAFKPIAHAAGPTLREASGDLRAFLRQKIATLAARARRWAA